MSKSVFEPVEIKWGDETYEVPANRVMGLIERIEDHLSFADLMSKSPKISKIACAYGEALRYAGATVTDDEVYADMFGSGGVNQAKNAVTGLLMIMIPPDNLQKKTQAGPVGKAPKKKK